LTITVDAATEHVRTDTTSPQTFSHVGAASGVKGVVLAICHGVSSTDHVSAASYGGTNLTRIQRNTDTAGEPGAAELWFLGASVPQGTQTVSYTPGSTTDDIQAVAITLLGAADLEVIDQDGISENATDPSVTLQYGGRSAMAFAAAYSGLGAPANWTPNANCTGVHDHDFGVFISKVIRQTTAGTADFAIGGTAALDDVAFAAIAVSEVAGPDIAATGSLSIAGIAALVATGALLAAGSVSIVGAADLDARGTIVAAGALSISGAADLDAIGQLLAAGSIFITGAADLTSAATDDIAAAGSLSITGAADLDAIGSVAAAGSIAIDGAADLDAVGNLLGAGSLAIAGAADLTGSASNDISAAGTLFITGAADLDGPGSLTAAGSVSITGAADLDAISNLLAAGTIVISGAANLTDGIVTPAVGLRITMTGADRSLEVQWFDRRLAGAAADQRLTITTG